MTRTTRTTRTQRGGVLIYIFVAIALLGALTLVVSRSTSGYVDTGEGDRLKAQALMAQSLSIVMGINRIRSFGTPYDSILLRSPEFPGYPNGAPSRQIFHPDGGGISFSQSTSQFFNALYSGGHWAGAGNFWYRHNLAVEGIGTTDTDVVVLAYAVNEAICREVNRLLYNDPTIPVVAQVATGAPGSLNNPTAPSNLSDVGTAVDGKQIFCIRSAPGDGWDNYVFYQVVLAR